MDKKRKHKVEHWQLLAMLLAFYDLVAIHCAYFVTLWVRFDCVYSSIPEVYLKGYLTSITIYAVICVVIFSLQRLYRIVWRFASVSELAKVVGTSLFMSAAYAVLITVIKGRMPMSFYLWGGLAQLFFVVAIRFSYRFFLFAKSIVTIQQPRLK